MQIQKPYRLFYVILLGLLILLVGACGTSTPVDSPADTQVAADEGAQDPPSETSPPAEPDPGIQEDASPPPLDEPIPDLRPVTVTSVSIEIGQGSPNPVEAVIFGLWPDPCAQLAELQQSLQGASFEINLLAAPPQPDCPPASGAEPFRLALPLNMGSLPAGAYTVRANGLQASFDWDPEAAAAIPQDSFPVMAYIGVDGNLWVLEAGTETPRQVTSDAVRIGSEGTAVEYGNPRLSSDGTLLAYSRDVGTPVEGGYDFTSSLWVMDLATGEGRQVVDARPISFDWQPGTHLLAYETEVDINYFMTRGQPDPELATGISAIDLDSGEISELVPPERGYALYGVNWSPDGRFLAFEELLYMEGSGPFAYYDLENQEYVAWDEPVGHVSWSPDGELLTYSRQTYAASGEERLYLRPRLGQEQLLGPDYDGPAYATLPEFSPAGDQVAYLAFLGGPETQTATIMVLDIESGEARELGQFESVWGLDWTPDGSHVVFNSGAWESRQIIALSVADGEQTVLAAGSQLALADQ